MSLRSEDGTLPLYEYPWTFDPSRWAIAAQALQATRVHSLGDLAKLIGTVGRISTEVSEYTNLFTAILELESELEGFQCLAQLLPKLQHDIVSAPTILGDGCAVLFHEYGACNVRFSHQQAYLVACLAFFGLCHPLCDQYSNEETKDEVEYRFGHLDWSEVYRRGGSVAVARIKCQLTYLHTVASRKTPENETYVTFYRTVLAPKATGLGWAEPSWATSPIPISSLQVTFSAQDKIEDVAADAHVDFANKFLHIGKIIPSATQEEVLFSIRPECFVGLLFSEMLQANEAIVITGARRFNNYSGYLRTFQYKGLHDESSEPNVPTIIAIDALVNSGNKQFNDDRIARDTNKAYLGFAGVQAPVPSTTEHLTFSSISTGQWGCGAFMGDPTLKCIQQILAAAQAGVTHLHYSAFHDVALAEKLTVILHGLQKRGITVGELYQCLVRDNQNVLGRFLSLISGPKESSVARFHRELKQLAGVV